jgi:hypothetical protein
VLGPSDLSTKPVWLPYGNRSFGFAELRDDAQLLHQA